MIENLHKHPYMLTEKCGACAHLIDDPDCRMCGGSGQCYKLKPSDLDCNTTTRIGDLLIHKSKEGSLEGRFDGWEPSHWIWIPGRAGLGAMLASARGRR